jgi:DNA replication protein DnaC
MIAAVSTASSTASAVSLEVLEVAAIRDHCKVLRLPSVADHCERLAEAALRERHGHLRFLDALLQVERDERLDRTVARRLQEARIPQVKTLEEFDFSKAASSVSAAQILSLAAGGYLERKEPILLLGDCGTGKTHLAMGLCVAACQQRRKVRFVTAGNLINELLESQHQNQLGRALSRFARYDLLTIDELGYIPLAELGAELLFQVISERAERASVMITTNLPFSEWTKVFTNARLCKALLDRLTDRAHIIETGSESYRFRRTLERRSRNNNITAGAGAESSRDGSGDLQEPEGDC